MHISGKEFRRLIGKEKQQIRVVPPFSYQSLQKKTVVYPPPRCFPFEKRPTKTTLFRLYFKRGDIPLCVGREPATRPPRDRKLPSVKWLFDPNNLDYCYYLPILIDGLAEKDIHLRELAQNAALDLIIRKPSKILPVVPQLILPFKRAFNTRDVKIIVISLKVLQQMVLLGPCVGQALVPYYRQLLPVCNQFRDVNVRLGCGVDANIENRCGDVIRNTLEILERCGGPDAYINIKYMVPTYESCVQN